MKYISILLIFFLSLSALGDRELSADRIRLKPRTQPTTGLSEGDLVYNSSTHKVNVRGASAWNDVGSGSGGINYITNTDLESDVSGYSAYADAAGATPVDGTGGSPTVTCTRTTSTPLRGTGSLLITKDAANRQGEGCGYPFTIDKADKGKMQTISADYEIASGTYADGDQTVYIYDVTNSRLIQPAGYSILNTTVQGKKIATFQASSDSTSYRLIIHTASTSSSAYTLKLDTIAVGPQNQTQGPPVTDWTAWTPTGSWVSNTTYTGYKRRVGDMGEYIVKVATSGAPTSANLTVSMPSGEVIDTAKLVTTSAVSMPLGKTSTNDSDTTFYSGDVLYSSTTAVLALTYKSDATYATIATNTQAVPITFGSGDSVVLNWRAPIVGWSANTVMSADTDTRVVAAVLTGSSTSITSSGVAIIPTTVTNDTHGAFSGSTYTVPVPGFYQLSAYILGASVADTAGNSITVRIFKNGSQLGFLCVIRVDRTATDSHACSGANAWNFIAGDTIVFKGFSSVTGTIQDFQASIFRLSGPAQVAASETVAAIISGDPASASSGNPIIVPTVGYDSHAPSYNATTGRYSVPIAGVYKMYGALQSASSATTLTIYKNAVSTDLAGNLDSNGEATFSGAVNCIVGDIIDIRPGGTVDATNMTLHIERIK